MFLGPEQLSDEELLALVLGSGAATPLARRLLRYQRWAPGLATSWTKGAVCALGGGSSQGLSDQGGARLGRRALAPEPLLGRHIRAPADIASVLSVELGLLEQEAVHVFGLDARHRIRHRHVAAVGQVDRVVVSLSDVFRPLVREGMAAVIVAHNHPSGELSPSEADEHLTLQLAQTATLLSIPLLDHVIVSRTGYYSFADHGLLSSPLALPSGKCSLVSDAERPCP